MGIKHTNHNLNITKPFSGFSVVGLDYDREYIPNVNQALVYSKKMTSKEDYIHYLRKDISEWLIKLELPKSHSINNVTFQEWLSSSLVWINDEEKWKEINIMENNRVYDSSLRIPFDYIKNLEKDNNQNTRPLPEEEFKRVMAIYDPEVKQVFINQEYLENERPSFLEVKNTLLHEYAHHISVSSDRTAIPYNFEEWSQEWLKLKKANKLPNDYSGVDACEGYAELFAAYWSSSPGIRRFRLGLYPPSVLRAIGAS